MIEEGKIRVLRPDMGWKNLERNAERLEDDRRILAVMRIKYQELLEDDSGFDVTAVKKDRDHLERRDRVLEAIKSSLRSEDIQFEDRHIRLFEVELFDLYDKRDPGI
jgi:hypothetical protein